MFGKKTITSSEFPLIVFDAQGTLLHSLPSIEKFLEHQLRERNIGISADEIEGARLRTSRHFIAVAERDTNAEIRIDDWWVQILKELKIEELTLGKRLLDSFRMGVKYAFPQLTLSVCEALSDRGYRLAVADDEGVELAETLRLQGVIDLFESVQTSKDVGVTKPLAKFFTNVLEDLDVAPAQAIYVGDCYATDIVGARRAGLSALLYDPTHRELKALHSDEEIAAKRVVSIEALRDHRRLQGVKILSRLDEMLDFCL